MRINYNSDLFQAATGQLVVDAFTAVLNGLVSDPGQLAGEADIMSAGDRALVTSRWPDAGPVEDPEATALALLWRACDGDRVVAVGTDGELTGAQVRARGQRVAAAVRQLGVSPGDRVAILLPRGARLLPAILGIWSAGASYVPLDSIYPDQRLAGMLSDSGAVAIVVDSGAVGSPGLPAGAPSMPVVDLARLPADSGGGDPLLDLPGSAVANTIFTSGSTGRPKGVNVTQGSIAAFLEAVRPKLALGPEDRFVAVTTISFDIALMELLAPVLAGGCVVIADSDQVLDAARLRQLVIDSGATAMQATPAGWWMLIDAGGIPDEVKLRVTGGEPCPGISPTR